MNTIVCASQISNVPRKEGKKELISATYATFNACKLLLHPPAHGCVVPAAFPNRPPQQCAGLFLAMGGH